MKVTQGSFAKFVYSFVFSMQSFEERVKTFSQREHKTLGWSVEKLPIDELLMHVADYINPLQGKPATAHAWSLSEDSLKAWRDGNARWELLTRYGGRDVSIEFEFVKVELFLFHLGVGFLIVTANPKGDVLEDWLDFLHFFRFLGGQRDVLIHAEERNPSRRGNQGVLDADASRYSGTTFDHVCELLQSLRLDKEDRIWWEEVFIHNQLLPFCSLFVDGIPHTDVAPLLYRVRNFSPARRELHPSAVDLSGDNERILPYADKEWFLFSLDGGSFVACNETDSEFFRATLPDHVRRHYFLLFILVLYQRFALTSLSMDVAKSWIVEGERREGEGVGYQQLKQHFERIHDKLLSFTARAYLRQVMQREHHHRYYRRWRETFQIDESYQDVSVEVREMHSFLMVRATEEEERSTKRLETTISMIAVLIGIPSLIFAFLGINLTGVTLQRTGIPIGLPIWLPILIGGCGIFLVGIALRILRRRV